MPTTTQNTALNQAISDLEGVRNSKVIVYITGDRKPENVFGTVIASDVLSYFEQILKKIGDTRKITLALYTNGGNLETPWPLVNLIRSHCKEFEVIVLHKALSAGTMIALGADKIVMNRYSHLSPVDPAANIADGTNQPKRFEIEDIIGYIDFVKDKIGITEQNALCEIMRDLTKEIPPTMLGSANRTHSLVRRLAKNLLGMHRIPVPESHSKEIIEHLTQKLFSHRHLINRKEAHKIGFEKLIEFPNKANSDIIEGLEEKYFEYLEMEKEFNPPEIIGTDEKKEVVVNRAVIHSKELMFSFQSNCLLTKIPNASGNPQVNVNITSNKWNKL